MGNNVLLSVAADRVLGMRRGNGLETSRGGYTEGKVRPNGRAYDTAADLITASNLKVHSRP